MEKINAELHARLWIECPNCDEDIDLFEDDPDGVYTVPVFNNSWDDLKEEEVYCPKCGHEFQIKEIVW